MQDMSLQEMSGMPTSHEEASEPIKNIEEQ
jgi:hypothetical protein